jgi:hypothetical protein
VRRLRSRPRREEVHNNVRVRHHMVPWASGWYRNGKGFEGPRGLDVPIVPYVRQCYFNVCSAAKQQLILIELNITFMSHMQGSVIQVLISSIQVASNLEIPEVVLQSD